MPRSRYYRTAAAATLLAGSLAVIWSVRYATGLPTVYTSYKTRECVRVEFAEAGVSGDCSNLPARYHHEWVE